MKTEILTPRNEAKVNCSFSFSPKVLCLLIIFLFFSFNKSSAYDFEVNGIYYNITDSINKIVEVTHSGNDSIKYRGDIVIPDNVNYNNIDYSIKKIGFSAFLGCEELKNVEIPKDVFHLENHAFEKCKGLTKIILPDSIQYIGWEAFKGCSNLTEIILPDKEEKIYVTIDNFMDTGWLENQPDGIVYINDYCIGIKNTVPNGEVNIKSGTRYISTSAFYNNNQIKSVVVPNSVISIEDMAFEGCKGLETIDFGNGVKEIGWGLLCVVQV